MSMLPKNGQPCSEKAILRGSGPGEIPRAAPSPLKVVMVADSSTHATILDEALREAGCVKPVLLEDTSHLAARIEAVDPDVIVIDLAAPTRAALDEMFQISRAVKRPIAMFVGESDPSATEAAVEAGISAYIVGGLQKERIKPILDLCISRFKAFARLIDELDRTRAALEDRKVIDRAKGILMQAKKVDEQEAYGLLRRAAMNDKKKIAEVAQSLIAAAELLK